MLNFNKIWNSRTDFHQVPKVNFNINPSVQCAAAVRANVTNVNTRLLATKLTRLETTHETKQSKFQLGVWRVNCVTARHVCETGVEGTIDLNFPPLLAWWRCGREYGKEMKPPTFASCLPVTDGKWSEWRKVVLVGAGGSVRHEHGAGRSNCKLHWRRSCCW